jgi:glycosyltransferase involved in cell wall biosynthesis
MKILFFHDDCQTMGGANTYRRELSRALKSLGHELYLFTLEPNHDKVEQCFYYTFRKGNVVVDHFKHRYFNPSLFIAFKRVLKEVGPDIIHIHTNIVFPNSVLLACGSIPVVQTLHDWRMICPLGKGVTVKDTICDRGFSSACYREGCISRWRYHSQFVWRKFNIFLFKRHVNALITPSMALNRALKNYGLESIYIANYVDTSRFSPSPPNTNGRTILCACHLFQSKGIHYLLRAFQNVLVKIPSARLDIVGDGPEKKDLEQLCISLKIQNSVRFHGAVPHAELAHFYSKVSVVVLPSVVAENCPLVVLEAMASARPVIGSRIGGIPELILENETGLLFEPGDTNELSEQIVQLLLNPERAERMGGFGRKRVEKEFSAQKHIERILDLYYSLLKNGSSGNCVNNRDPLL